MQGAYNLSRLAMLASSGGRVPERLLDDKLLRDAMQKGGHASERALALALWPEVCTCEGRDTEWYNARRVQLREAGQIAELGR